MNKISICFFVLLGVAVIFSPSENVYGKELIFDSESISKVDLEIALYDLKINYLNVWNINQMAPYIDAIATSTEGKSQLHTNVFVISSIMEGTINEKKQRIKTLCNLLFEIAKNHFKLKYANDPRGGCYLCLTPWHINMNIHMRTSGLDTIVIAKWRDGEILYTDAFLK